MWVFNFITKNVNLNFVETHVLIKALVDAITQNWSNFGEFYFVIKTSINMFYNVPQESNQKNRY